MKEIAFYGIYSILMLVPYLTIYIIYMMVYSCAGFIINHKIKIHSILIASPQQKLSQGSLRNNVRLSCSAIWGWKGVLVVDFRDYKSKWKLIWKNWEKI